MIWNIWIVILFISAEADDAIERKKAPITSLDTNSVENEADNEIETEKAWMNFNFHTDYMNEILKRVGANLSTETTTETITETTTEKFDREAFDNAMIMTRQFTDKFSRLGNEFPPALKDVSLEGVRSLEKELSERIALQNKLLNEQFSRDVTPEDFLRFVIENYADLLEDEEGRPLLWVFSGEDLQDSQKIISDGDMEGVVFVIDLDRLSGGPGVVKPGMDNEWLYKEPEYGYGYGNGNNNGSGGSGGKNPYQGGSKDYNPNILYRSLSKPPNYIQSVAFQELIRDCVSFHAQALLNYMEMYDLENSKLAYRKLSECMRKLRSHGYNYYPTHKQIDHHDGMVKMIDIILSYGNPIMNKKKIEDEMAWMNLKNYLRLLINMCTAFEQSGYYWLYDFPAVFLVEPFTVKDFQARFNQENTPMSDISVDDKSKFEKFIVQLMETTHKMIVGMRDRDVSRCFSISIDLRNVIKEWKSFGAEYYPLENPEKHTEYIKMANRIITALDVIFTNKNSMSWAAPDLINDLVTYLSIVQTMCSDFIKEGFLWLHPDRQSRLTDLAEKYIMPIEKFL